MNTVKLVGTGLGFRDENISEIFLSKPQIPWFELLIDNYMADNSDIFIIDQLRENYPLTFHGVGLNIGSVDGINFRYLAKLKLLQERWEPALISDHFSWTGTRSGRFHELLPLTYTEESIKHIVDRVSLIQDFLGRQIILENASTYVQAPSEMPEWEFINQVCAQSGCGLLLDVNNVHVNAFNHKFSALETIQNIKMEFVQEIHLAGYEDMGHYYFDSHSRPVTEEVWEIFAKVLNIIPNVPCLLEWDNKIPALSILMEEIEKAEDIRDSIACVV